MPERPSLFAGRGGPAFEMPDRRTEAPAMPIALAAARCRLAREIASAVLCVPVEEIARPNRSAAETCKARHLAIYLAHVVFQVSLGAIAVHFGRDRTSVAHAVRRIEDGRDLPAFELLVARLERLAGACLDLSAEEPTA
ncbi:hypothetical protein ASG54_20865 [Aureimonas sp. Leaf460]|nr:hypothetical protein ASG54_20865 [Aureimonas sp. Leaf460]